MSSISCKCVDDSFRDWTTVGCLFFLVGEVPEEIIFSSGVELRNEGGSGE